MSLLAVPYIRGFRLGQPRQWKRSL